MVENKNERGISEEKACQIIRLYSEISKLKKLYRQGWLENGVSEKDCESVADHSFLTAFLGYLIANECRPDLNPLKVMELCMVHDLSEVHAGDITPRQKMSEEEKFQKNYEGIKKIFSKLPNGEKYVELWLEFEEQKSPEAKFAKEVDKLEMALQAFLYEKMGYRGLDVYFTDVQSKISSKELKLILAELMKSR
jgi:putative hydrolase of HD superfamily